jgi:hypothetical protein
MNKLLLTLLLSTSSAETRRDCFHITDNGTDVNCCDTTIDHDRIVRVCVRASAKTAWQPFSGAACEQEDGGWSPCEPRKRGDPVTPATPPSVPAPQPGQVRIKL